MIIPKIIETRLDIKNVNDIYTTDYNAMMMRHLNNKFLNICFKSILIKKIVRILRRGRITCVATSLEGHAYVEVTFEVEGHVFLPGEIIQKCRVEKIIGEERKTMFLETDLCSIQVDYRSADIYSIKDHIPIIVKRSRYNINGNKVSILAQDFRPMPILATYYVVKDSNKFKAESNASDQEADLNHFTDNYQEMRSRLDKYDPEDVEFFIKLLYPYVDESIPYGHIVGEKMSIDDFDSLADGDVIYVSDNYLDEFIFYKINKPAGDFISVDISKQNLYKHLSDAYVLNLHNLFGFLDEYPKAVRQELPTDSSINTIWKLYDQNKFEELNQYDVTPEEPTIKEKSLFNPVRELKEDPKE